MGLLSPSSRNLAPRTPQCLSPCRSRYCPVVPRGTRKYFAAPAINRSNNMCMYIYIISIISNRFPILGGFTMGKPTELVNLSKIQGLAKPQRIAMGKYIDGKVIQGYLKYKMIFFNMRFTMRFWCSLFFHKYDLLTSKVCQSLCGRDRFSLDLLGHCLEETQELIQCSI